MRVYNALAYSFAWGICEVISDDSLLIIILYVAISRDGYLADEQGGVGWLSVENPEQDYGYESFYRSIDALVMGSKTYEQIISFGAWPYPGKTTYVFSKRKLKSVDKDIIFVPVDVNVFIDNLKKDKSVNNLWLVGGGQLINSFASLGLIDESIITTVPKDLRKGLSLPGNVLTHSTLQEEKTRLFPDKVTQHYYVKRYEPVRREIRQKDHIQQ
jgi:dihydrofolate reductase